MFTECSEFTNECTGTVWLLSKDEIPNLPRVCIDSICSRISIKLNPRKTG